MRTLLLLSTLFTALFASAVASTLDFPEIPGSKRVITLEETKNYWVNMMPTPVEPRRLARDYQKLMVTYHQQVGERHRLIQAIRAGRHDKYAKIAMLRHNLQAYWLRGNKAMIAKAAAELDQLEGIAQADEDKRANAERLERLIAATERLAAAIEKNGGAIPANADQLVDDIVPFERDRNDRRSLITYLNDEIALCRQPIIAYRPHDHSHSTHGHSHSHRTATTSHPTKTPAYVHPPGSHSTGSSGRHNIVPRQPQVQQPQVPQPQVRPAPAVQPQARPIQVRQPQIRPAR